MAKKSMKIKRAVIPKEVIKAMEQGETLTHYQLYRLIRAEAEILGLSFDEAVDKILDDTLTHNPIGSDLRLLIPMLLPNE